MTFAGKAVTIDEVRGTLELFRRLRENRRVAGPEWSRAAGDRLAWLVHVAINRKAGIADVAGRRQEPDWQAAMRRECVEIRDHRRWRRRLHGLNGRRFQTDLIQARFGHLLAGDAD